jgi:hypothetical protein
LHDAGKKSVKVEIQAFYFCGFSHIQPRENDTAYKNK